MLEGKHLKGCASNRVRWRWHEPWTQPQPQEESCLVFNDVCVRVYQPPKTRGEGHKLELQAPVSHRMWGLQAGVAGGYKPPNVGAGR